MPVSHYQRGDSCGFIKNSSQEGFPEEGWGARPCLDNGANSKELILLRGEGGDLEDGPTNTHEPHGILVALNISVLSIQDNQSSVQCICRRLGVELRDRERSLSHPAEVCPAEARKARSQNQKSEEPMGGYSEESFPGDRKQGVGSTFFNYRFKLN